ncbi:hypothetical protein GCM10020254_86770 [Streptomyces goshikiensis]
MSTPPETDGFLFNFDPEAIAAQILAQPAPPPVPAQGGEQAHLHHATVAGLIPDTLSDRGNAKLFVRLYAGDYRHVPGLGWYRWDTTRWQVDEDDTVVWAAGDLAEAIATTDPRGIHSNQALQKHRRRALSTSGMNAMLTQAKAAPGMVLRAELLDADPYALCTPRGHRRPPHRPHPYPRAGQGLPLPLDIHCPPSRSPPRAGTASWPTPSETMPKAGR